MLSPVFLMLFVILSPVSPMLFVLLFVVCPRLISFLSCTEAQQVQRFRLIPHLSGPQASVEQIASRCEKRRAGDIAVADRAVRPQHRDCLRDRLRTRATAALEVVWQTRCAHPHP